MILKTFDEILTVMCDAYDSYNTPYKVRRSNKNTLYLLLKAIAKGYEVINNVATLISNKFDPALCADSDLLSTAKITGTAMLLGTGSGLNIIVHNDTLVAVAVTLYAGDYKYTQSVEVVFVFNVPVDVAIPAGTSVTYTAFTAVVGSYPVTAIANLPVLRVDAELIDSGLSFACLDNAPMLGYPDETPVAFRKRILTDTSRQDTIKELELAIRNLPYIFDCKLLFNNTPSPVVVNGVTVPIYHLLVVLSGNPRNEIAEMIAAKGIFPTVQVVPTDVLYLYSDIFVGGKYPVYFTPFAAFNYTLRLTYLFDASLISDAIVQSTINEATNNLRYANVYTKYVTEDMFYNTINALSVVSVKLLGVALYVGASQVSYFEVPSNQIPILTGITYYGSAI